MEFGVTNDAGGDTRELSPFGKVLPNGNIVVAWTQFRTGESGRFTSLRIVEPDGTVVTGELDIEPGVYDRGDAEIVVLSDGKFLLIQTAAVITATDFYFEVYGYVITSDGSTLTAGPRIDLTPDLLGSGGQIEAVLLDNGSVAIVSDLSTDRANLDDPFVAMAVVDQNLNVLTDFTRIGERAQNSPSSLNADVDGDTVAISWTQNAGGFSVPTLGKTISVNPDGSLAPFTLDDIIDESLDDKKMTIICSKFGPLEHVPNAGRVVFSICF